MESGRMGRGQEQGARMPGYGGGLQTAAGP